MKIPSNNVWTQTNEGDRLGVLHSTRNITLDTPGKARLSQKSIAIMTVGSPSNLAYGLSIVFYDDLYTIVHVDGVETFDLLGTAIGNTGIDPVPTIYGDGIIFNDLLHVTTNTSLSAYTGSSWNNSLETNTNSVPHPMEIFDSLTTYKLAIGNGNTVKLLDVSYNNSTAVLTLPSQFVVTTLAYSNGYMYVGTKNKNGGQAKIFIWDGNGNNANYEVPVSGNWVYSVKPYQSSVCAVTSSGELIYINGTTPQRLAGLPVFFHPTANWQGSLDSDVPRVFHRGMETDGELIYLNVNALVETGGSGDYLPGFESGVWVYDPQNGLYQKASANRVDEYVIDTGISVTDSTITTSTAHNLITGDTVVFKGIGGLSGVGTTVVYYVKVLSTTTLKLASSRRALEDEEYITITGTATASDELVYTPNTEYFQYARVSSGAITKTTAYSGYLDNWKTPIIWTSSSQLKTIAGTSYSVNILADSYNIGFLETQRIYSDNIEQSWKKVYSFLDGLDVSSEQVIVKYRTEEESGYPTNAILGTWLDTDTFNITKEDCPFVEVGNEMMIVDGYGRGYSAHVTDVHESTNTLSITVDESVGTANQPARVVFTNYKKATVHTLQDKTNGFTTATVDTSSPWVQIKVELRGFETAVNMFDLSNEKHSGSK